MKFPQNDVLKALAILLCSGCRSGGAPEPPPTEFSLNVARLTNVSPTTPIWLDLLEYSDIARAQTAFNGYAASVRLVRWPEQTMVPLEPIQEPYLAADASFAGLELLRSTRFTLRPTEALTERWYAVVLAAPLPTQTMIAKQWLAIPLANGGSAIPFRVGSAPMIQTIRSCRNPDGRPVRSLVEFNFSEPVNIQNPRANAVRFVSSATGMTLECTSPNDSGMLRSSFVFECPMDELLQNYQIVVTPTAIRSVTNVALTQPGMAGDTFALTISAATTATESRDCRRFVPSL